MLDMLGVDPRRLEVDADRSCVGCAYNLRTLPIDSRCPECSTPIALSLRPNELEFVDPEWLLKVRGGVFALLVVSIGMVVAMLLGGVGVTGIASCSAMSVIPLLVILYVLFAVGVFRATTTEPSAASETAFDSARFAARVFVFSPLILGPLAYVGLAGSLGVVLARIRRLAQRANERRLAARCSWAIASLWPTGAAYLVARFAPFMAYELTAPLLWIVLAVTIATAIVCSVTLAAARSMLGRAIVRNRFAYTPAAVAAASAEQRSISSC
jgi:hypothetical protein